MSGNTHNIDCLILSGDIFSLGGIQTYCRQVFGALESGFKDKNFVSLVLNDTPGHELEKWQNIKIFFCAQIKISLFKKIYFVFKALKLSFVVRPKFILCCHTHIAPIALLIKCFFGIDYGVIVYGSDVWDLRKGMRFQALKEAGLIISLSNYTRARIIDNGLDGKNLMVLHPAVDTSFFRPLSANKELSQRLMLDNKKVLLIIARMDSREKQKGHDVMLEVMRRLSDNFVLVIFGNGDDVGRLKKKSNELGIADKVRFHPAFSGSDTLDFYNLCDVFVMPSKQEGFGIVFIEALACGKPVVAGFKDGSKEALMDGKLGFLVDPDDPSDIAQAIQAACVAGQAKTDAAYLKKEVEASFGIGVFNARFKELFYRYL